MASDIKENGDNKEYFKSNVIQGLLLLRMTEYVSNDRAEDK